MKSIRPMHQTAPLESAYFPLSKKQHAPSASGRQHQPVPGEHNMFRFPLTKNVLWDQTPMGASTLLHMTHNRNISLSVSEAAVRLAHRHAQQAESHSYIGFLVGAVTVDADEEGITILLDRFDPGRDIPGRGARLPTAKLPGDFLVPLTILLGEADISATHTIQDFINSFKFLETNCSSHGSVDPSHRLALRILCRCHSNTDDITFSLHFGVVTVATKFAASPIKPIPLIPTALARNLMGPLSLSDVQGTYKTGFITMDETRKLLLLLESDPKTSALPLVGIWLSGVTQLTNPVVWSACLRYIKSNGIQERVYSSSRGFLLVLFTQTSRQPLFYECSVNQDKEPCFMLVGCRENLHVFKHASAKGKPPVEMELTPARSGPSKSLFLQALAQMAQQDQSRSGPPRSGPGPKRRSSSSSMPPSLREDESQHIPRPSPKPIMDKSPSVKPSVPELSFISDSFCEPSDFLKTAKSQQQPVINSQEHQSMSQMKQSKLPKPRARLQGQSDVPGRRAKENVGQVRQRLPATSTTPPTQGENDIRLRGNKSHVPRQWQNRPGPLRTLNDPDRIGAPHQRPMQDTSEQFMPSRSQRGERPSHEQSQRLSGTVHHRDVGSKSEKVAEKRTMPVNSDEDGSQKDRSVGRKSHRHSRSSQGDSKELEAPHAQNQHMQRQRQRQQNESGQASDVAIQSLSYSQHVASSKSVDVSVVLQSVQHISRHASIATNQSQNANVAQTMTIKHASVRQAFASPSGQSNAVIQHREKRNQEQGTNTHLDVLQPPHFHVSQPASHTSPATSSPSTEALPCTPGTESSTGAFQGIPASVASSMGNSVDVVSAEGSLRQLHQSFTGVNAQQAHVGLGSDQGAVPVLPLSSDARSGARSPGFDSRTMEQLKKQEEMIQQLQEQIKLLLQVQAAQQSASVPAGLVTPPATPQGHQNLPANPNQDLVQSPSPHSFGNQSHASQSPRELPPAVHSHSAPRQGTIGTNSDQGKWLTGLPQYHHSGPGQKTSDNPTSRGSEERQCSTQRQMGPLFPTPGEALTDGHHMALSSDHPENPQSGIRPLTCSMAVNTGQSLLWPGQQHEGASPPQLSNLPPAKKSRGDHATGQIRQSGSTCGTPSRTPSGSESQNEVDAETGGCYSEVPLTRSESQRLSRDILQQTRDETQSNDHVDMSSCQDTAEKSLPHSGHPWDLNATPERRDTSDSSYTFGADLSSPGLGESASTYVQRHRHHDSSDSSSSSDSSDEESSNSEGVETEEREKSRGGGQSMEKGGLSDALAKEENRCNVASPSLLYRDEKKFYSNLLGQVQKLLNPEDQEGNCGEDTGGSDHDPPRVLPDLSMATLDELEKLGINLRGGDVTIDERSLYRSLYNVSPDLHPHINYISLADFAFDQTDVSMEANAIAMKYLSDTELAKISAGFAGDKSPNKLSSLVSSATGGEVCPLGFRSDRTPGKSSGGVNPLLRTVLTGIREEAVERADGGGGGGGHFDSSFAVNMSLASRKYMEKYGLLSGSDTGGMIAVPASPGDATTTTTNVQPSLVRFFKSPAVARTFLPRTGGDDSRKLQKAKPTRLSYSQMHADKEPKAPVSGDNLVPQAQEKRPVLGAGASENVLDNLKGRKTDDRKEQSDLSDSGRRATGKILDIGKLQQLPKLL